MRSRYTSKIAFVLIGALAACSGPGSSGTSLPTAPNAARPVQQNIAPGTDENGHKPFKRVHCHARPKQHERCVDAKAIVKLYKRVKPTKPPVNGIFAVHAGGRDPHFVSPSTNGIAWTAYLHGTQTVAASDTADTSSGSALCTSGSPRTCSIPLAVTGSPTGIGYDFVMTLWDQKPNGSGNIPAAANELGVSNLTTTVFSNQANNFAFAVDGIWVTTNPVIGGAAATYQSLPGDGSAHTLSVNVQALDADGNVITGPNPYASPVPIALTETGGSGHTNLVINGTGSALSGNLAKPADSLSLSYDGNGAVGYSTSTNMGGSTVVVSPLYVTPGTATSFKLVDSKVTTATEKNAPAGIAYSSTLGTCTPTVGRAIAGSGGSATVTMTTNSPPGTSQTCNVNVIDILGTSIAYKLVFSVSGPLGTPGPVTFPTGGSGSCNTAVAFTAAGQTAVVTINDPLYTGVITAGTSAASVATVTTSGSGVSTSATVTAVAAGTATITFSDTTGNSTTCPIGVTTSGGSVS